MSTDLWGIARDVIGKEIHFQACRDRMCRGWERHTNPEREHYREMADFAIREMCDLGVALTESVRVPS